MDLDRKPHKYKKKKKDKKKKKKVHKSSSSSESSSNEEWVEATSVKQPLPSLDPRKEPETSAQTKSKDADEWMSFSEQFPTITRDQIREKNKPKEDEKKSVLDCLGQSERELNPYWKDGGTGLPKEIKDLHVTDSAIGDHGLDWLRRALCRAKEQAAEEGRSLENVVSERWGSLEKLQSMIREAEKRANNSVDNKNHKWRGNDRFRWNGGDRNDKGRDEKYRDGSDRYDHDRKEKYSWKERDSSRKQSFMKPHDNDSYEGDRCKNTDYKSSRDWGKDDTRKKAFMKPADDDSHHSPKERDREESGSCSDSRRDHGEHSTSRGRLSKKGFARPCDDDEGRQNSKNSRYSSQSSSGRGWRKQPPKDDKKEVEKKKDSPEVHVGAKYDDSDDDQGNKVAGSAGETNVPAVPLTADERNELAAKLLKAEILGNTELVKELKSRLEQARIDAAAPEKVVLTHTNARGFTQPLSLSGGQGGSGRKREKVKTHDDGGKRVRYFPDDDRFTLQDMFEREKRSTVEDQNEIFARLASKNVGRDESARDMDDVFEEMARVQESADKTNARARDKAISEHKRSSQAVDSCQWCLDSKHLLKHLIVAVGNKVYLCLPPYESLTEGHCLLIPTQHITCGVQSDEEVWEELQTFRKTLVQLFLSMDMDIVFFEYAARFARFPHMVLHCVPLPKESGDVAPIYFKKAILECETEWSSNKKLVDLAGRNIRRAVPRGLPYFSVDFGLQAGYAHVIEDESIFPNNFAQEIIGGMLDVDHSKWRKPRKEKFDDQRKKVVAFTKWWQPFDFTKSDKKDEKEKCL